MISQNAAQSFTYYKDEYQQNVELKAINLYLHLQKNREQEKAKKEQGYFNEINEFTNYIWSTELPKIFCSSDNKANENLYNIYSKYTLHKEHLKIIQEKKQEIITGLIKKTAQQYFNQSGLTKKESLQRATINVYLTDFIETLILAEKETIANLFKLDGSTHYYRDIYKENYRIAHKYFDITQLILNLNALSEELGELYQNFGSKEYENLLENITAIFDTFVKKPLFEIAPYTSNLTKKEDVLYIEQTEKSLNYWVLNPTADDKQHTYFGSIPHDSIDELKNLKVEDIQSLPKTSKIFKQILEKVFKANHIKRGNRTFEDPHFQIIEKSCSTGQEPFRVIPHHWIEQLQQLKTQLIRNIKGILNENFTYAEKELASYYEQASQSFKPETKIAPPSGILLGDLLKKLWGEHLLNYQNKKEPLPFEDPNNIIKDTLNNPLIFKGYTSEGLPFMLVTDYCNESIINSILNDVDRLAEMLSDGILPEKVFKDLPSPTSPISLAITYHKNNQLLCSYEGTAGCFGKNNEINAVKTFSLKERTISSKEKNDSLAYFNHNEELVSTIEIPFVFQQKIIQKNIYRHEAEHFKKLTDNDLLKKTGVFISNEINKLKEEKKHPLPRLTRHYATCNRALVNPNEKNISRLINRSYSLALSPGEKALGVSFSSLSIGLIGIGIGLCFGPFAPMVAAAILAVGLVSGGISLKNFGVFKPQPLKHAAKDLAKKRQQIHIKPL